MRLSNTVMGALAQMLPDTVPACEAGGETGISIAGYTKDRTPFAFIEFLLCGWGGRPDADGIDGCASIVVNTANNPVEVIEKDHPIQILKYEYVPNSGGVGKHRGALAIARSYRFTEDEGILQLRSDRTRFSPYGLSGGGPGALAHTTMISGGDPIELPSKTLLPIRQGDILHHNLTGGGGWGVPFQRDPDLVLHDVRNEKISLDSAYTDYGVSIDPNTWTIQENDTAKLRSRSTES
jgi:N-methylhydantoinase B